MPHIIANPFTLTEFLLDSLPPEERAGVLVHPKRIKGVAYSLLKALDAWRGFGLFLPRICRRCKPFRRKRRC